ncbi:hypothetical protein Acr_06g0006550 [Actinidia rufa]|uniref:HAT dimerization domain-containing protein n=1 Tax=Actinidia rufa TaxID=165716 RepID=A0A7J0EQE6_9ERIC|nr:hypothetical protein Acr_06g0006550 [Actinidia rufa]
MDPKESIHSEGEGPEEDEIERPTATPLWRYVTKVTGETSKSKSGGGSGKFICNFGCQTKPFIGSYSRVHAQLIGLEPGERAKGINLCHVLSKQERGMLKKEEMDARRIFGGNAKVKKLPKRHSNATNMVTAIKNEPKGYKSPNYEKVRTSLLDKQQGKVKHALSPLMQEWATNGVSIIYDGWSNLKNQPLINVMAVSGGKAIFLNGHDVSAVEKTGANIAELLLKAIDFVGPSNVVQVVTDNASNCKSAGGIIKRKRPHIFWSGCLAHTLNLLMKDTAKYKTTNFGHHFIVLQRLVTVRASLVSMALSNQWESLRRGASAPDQHDTVQKTVLDDDDFWRKAKRVLKITKPIYRMLRSWFDRGVTGYLEAIDRMILDPSEATLIRHQISNFVRSKGVFAQPQAVNDRATMNTLSWWHMYGGAASELYSLAIRVLSQSVNTYCAESCWSTYSYIHSVKRNRLNNDRAEKLVFAQYNHRLLSRHREDYESFKIGTCLMKMPILKKMS